MLTWSRATGLQAMGGYLLARTSRENVGPASTLRERHAERNAAGMGPSLHPLPKTCLPLKTARAAASILCSAATASERRTAMRQMVIAVMTAAMVAAAGGKALAQAPPAGGPPSRMAAALGLTDEQKAVWQQAFATMRATTAPLHAQARAIRGEIEALFAAGNPDPAL